MSFEEYEKELNEGQGRRHLTTSDESDLEWKTTRDLCVAGFDGFSGVRETEHSESIVELQASEWHDEVKASDKDLYWTPDFEDQRYEQGSGDATAVDTKGSFWTPDSLQSYEGYEWERSGGNKDEADCSSWVTKVTESSEYDSLNPSSESSLEITGSAFLNEREPKKLWSSSSKLNEKDKYKLDRHLDTSHLSLPVGGKTSFQSIPIQTPQRVAATRTPPPPPPHPSLANSVSEVKRASDSSSSMQVLIPNLVKNTGVTKLPPRGCDNMHRSQPSVLAPPLPQYYSTHSMPVIYSQTHWRQEREMDKKPIVTYTNDCQEPIESSWVPEPVAKKSYNYSTQRNSFPGLCVPYQSHWHNMSLQQYYQMTADWYNQQWAAYYSYTYDDHDPWGMIAYNQQYSHPIPPAFPQPRYEDHKPLYESPVQSDWSKKRVFPAKIAKVVENKLEVNSITEVIESKKKRVEENNVMKNRKAMKLVFSEASKPQQRYEETKELPKMIQKDRSKIDELYKKYNIYNYASEKESRSQKIGERNETKDVNLVPSPRAQSPLPKPDQTLPISPTPSFTQVPTPPTKKPSSLTNLPSELESELPQAVDMKSEESKPEENPDDDILETAQRIIENYKNSVIGKIKGDPIDVPTVRPHFVKDIAGDAGSKLYKRQEKKSKMQLPPVPDRLYRVKWKDAFREHLSSEDEMLSDEASVRRMSSFISSEVTYEKEDPRMVKRITSTYLGYGLQNLPFESL